MWWVREREAGRQLLASAGSLQHAKFRCPAALLEWRPSGELDDVPTRPSLPPTHLQQLQLAGLDHGAQRLAHAQPHGQVEPNLRG